MPEERLLSISSSSHLTPDDVARHSFGTVRRGFDPNEVRAYLESLAVSLRGVGERERQLLDELSEAEHRAAHPVLDEATLTAALGTETARVLHSAHEVATEMVAKSEAEANRLLTEAREEIQQSRSHTEARLAEQSAAIEAAASELRERTEHQAAATMDDAKREADLLLEQTREQCRAMVDEAQGLRARVLADLSKRRKVLHAQIEQLRAGRERLAETVHDVRHSVDAIASDLFAAEDNARLAAEAAGRAALDHVETGTPEELAAQLLADEQEAAVAAEAGSVDVQPGEPDPPEGAETTEVVEVAAEDGGVPEASAGLEDGPLALEGGTAPGEVDALFAKLRAAREGEPEPEPEPEPKPEPVPESEVVIPPAAATTADGPPEQVDAPEAAADQGGSDGMDGASDEEGDGPPDERSPQAVRRDELIDPIVTTLSRRLKRTLQDSQNELLDSLRSNGSRWSADLLPDETEHFDSVSTAAIPALEQSAAAGVSFSGLRGATGPKTDVLLGIAHELAEAVVGPLRRRLAAGDGLEGAEESVVAEHVGSAFREWKGERVERLAGDHVVAAFSAGTIAAALGAGSVPLEWVAVSDSGDAPCPDCEDNGLNGSQAPGEEFPTGHRHPPAHPGCRCLLALSAT
jgi:DivIVA domain-containing protein